MQNLLADLAEFAVSLFVQRSLFGLNSYPWQDRAQEDHLGVFERAATIADQLERLIVQVVQIYHDHKNHKSFTQMKWDRPLIYCNKRKQDMKIRIRENLTL